MSDDATEIANLKASYCLAADVSASNEAAARAMFADLFTEDSTGDYGFGTMEGPQAIADFLCQAISAGSEWMLHMLGSPRIEVDGDTATGNWTIQVESRRRKGERMMKVVGRYSDTFRKTKTGWRIASITFFRLE